MENIQSRSHMNVRRIAVTGVLSALSIVLYYTPLGFMLIPGVPAQITFMHVPVIIGAIMEGPVVGGIIGLVFGVFSLYTATFTPVIGFAFLNPLVSVVPRILIGIVAYYVYKGMVSIIKKRNQTVPIIVAATAGTLTNTVGVLGMIYILYAKPFCEAIGIQGPSRLAIIFGLAFPNAPFELVAAILLSIPVVIALKRVLHRA